MHTCNLCKALDRDGIDSRFPGTRCKDHSGVRDYRGTGVSWLSNGRGRTIAGAAVLEVLTLRRRPHQISWSCAAHRDDVSFILCLGGLDT
jgi:hypothetical protein